MCIDSERKTNSNKVIKANVLEKIYLSKDSIESIPNDNPLLQILSIKEDGDIEYVRTDAFIEKACGWLEPEVMIMLSGDKIDTDKFIEDFRKYMEGE